MYAGDLPFNVFFDLQKHSGEYEPSWVKFKYGAWYLPPKMWKRRPEEEALQDPKELKDQEMSEAKKKGNELVIIESLHLYSTNTSTLHTVAQRNTASIAKASVWDDHLNAQFLPYFMFS